MATEPEAPPPRSETSPLFAKMATFIEKYTIFLSSFVLGLAGLVGTCMHQSNQTKIEREKAEAEIRVSKIESDVKWQIARAEILSKHLQTLLDRKPETMDQRYGVLLSLTRGDVIDPELAMSYALDLANSEYIKGVIVNIKRKSYEQIFNNFRLTCGLRYGIWKDAPTCKATDVFEDRADALTDVVLEDLRRGDKEPFRLLNDERFVRANLMRLVYLYDPYLRLEYERQNFSQIASFESQNPGAELIAAFVLAASGSHAQPLGTAEANFRNQFHEKRRQRLEKALLQSSCDAECKGLASEMLLNGLPDYGEAYAGILRQLLVKETPDAVQVVARLHSRLLWCQVASTALDRLIRDVLVPAAKQLAAVKPERDKGHPGGNGRISEDVVGLLSLVPLPLDVKIPEAMNGAVEALRPQAKRQRDNPPLAIRQLGKNFCMAHEADVSADTEE